MINKFCIWLIVTLLLVSGCNSDTGTKHGKLTISVTGAGSVLSQDNKFECNVECDFSISSNQSVILIPQSGDNIKVTSWSGCESSDETQCTVTIGPDYGNVHIAVVFEKYKNNVNVSITGNGSVVSDDGSLVCPSDCSVPFETDKSITLSAPGDKNYQFLEWSNCPLIVDTNKCQITVGPSSDNVNVSVVFDRYQNTVTVQQNGAGVVTSADGLIDCGVACESNYQDVGIVELIATANTDYKFIDWTGCYSSTDNSCFVQTGPDTHDFNVAARYNPLTVNLYNLTFEQPEHQVGHPPTYGFGPAYVTEDYAIGTSREQFSPFIYNDTVANSNVLVFQAQSNGSNIIGDELSLALGEKAERYRFEWDMQINQISDFTIYKVFFDWPNSNNELDFNVNGNIFFNSVAVSTYILKQPFHVSVDIDLVNKLADVAINTDKVTGIPIDSATTDIGSIRYYLFGANVTDNYSIDNIIISARLNSQLTVTPPNDNNEYIVDFDSPSITSSSGQFSTGVSPYNENNFNITEVLRRDPVLNQPGIPSNGSINAGLALYSNPILYHQYGYVFSLYSIDIAEYSSITGPSSGEIVGYKRNGGVVTKTIDSSVIGADFTTIVFGSDWKDLNYVMFNIDGNTIDNVVLGVSDSMTQFEWTNLQ